MISKEHLDKFKKIYKKHFKVELSDQDALEKATKCLRMVELVYKPITADKYKKHSKPKQL
jgi:hypothetical protein